MIREVLSTSQRYLYALILVQEEWWHSRELHAQRQGEKWKTLSCVCHVKVTVMICIKFKIQFERPFNFYWTLQFSMKDALINCDSLLFPSLSDTHPKIYAKDAGYSEINESPQYLLGLCDMLIYLVTLQKKAYRFISSIVFPVTLFTKYKYLLTAVQCFVFFITARQQAGSLHINRHGVETSQDEKRGYFCWMDVV